MAKTVQAFEQGDKVKVLRKAASHENGWENSWESEMDAAVGKTGTVVSGESYNVGLRHNVNVKVPGVDQFGYPSFVLELVKPTPVPVSFPKLKAGDRVQVKYGHAWWDGPATVRNVYEDGYVSVTTDSNQAGAFHPKHISLISPAVPVAPITLAKREFKVGDRVQVKWGYGWDGPATVTKVGPYIQVNSDLRGIGGFLKENLTLIPQFPVNETISPKAEVAAKEKGIAGAVKSHSKVFGIAKDLAIKTALRDPQHITTADAVQAELVKLGYSSTDLGNAAGGLFRGKGWKKLSTVKSARKGNHAREIAAWEYVG